MEAKKPKTKKRIHRIQLKVVPVVSAAQTVRRMTGKDSKDSSKRLRSMEAAPASDVAEEIFITPPSLEFQHQMFWQSYANRFKEKRGGSYLPCYTHSHRIIDEWRI